MKNLGLFLVFMIITSPSSIAQANMAEFLPSQKYENSFKFFRGEEGGKILADLTKTPTGPLKIVFKECGMANAFYSRNTRNITICYELGNAITTAIRRDLKDTSSGRTKELEVGAFIFILRHEYAHAVIDLADLPILGGEEDAADRFATVTLLLSGNTDKATAAKTIIEGALLFFDARKKPGILDGFKTKTRNYADEHPLNEQRVFNILCLAYGSNPGFFAEMAAEQKMPKSRLTRCGSEYKDAKHAIETLLSKNTIVVKQAKKVDADIDRRDSAVMTKVHSGFVNFGEGIIRAPDVVSDGALTPIEINLNTPISDGDCLYAIPDGNYISHKICPTGDVQIKLVSLRVKVPTSGRILAAVAKRSGDVIILHKQANIIGYELDGLPQSHSALRMKSKANRLGSDTDMRLLINSAMTANDFIRQLRYTFSTNNQIDVYMTPHASKNPYLGFKALNLDSFSSYSVLAIDAAGVNISENVQIQ
jgi:predicted secreted protein